MFADHRNYYSSLPLLRRAISHVISCRLVAVKSRVRSQALHVGFLVDKVTPSGELAFEEDMDWTWTD